MNQFTPNAAAVPGLTIIPFVSSHLGDALRLSQAESWPHRLEDWALSLSVSQGVVALQGGRVVGTALCTVFGGVATMNMIIVSSDLRGHGLGRKLMHAVMQFAGVREMRLVATADGKPLYEKLGFQAMGQIFQHQGIAQAQAVDMPVTIQDAATAAAEVDTLAAMDRDATGMERRALLAGFAQQATVLRAESGFAMLRDFGRGTALGPVVARDTATARALICAAVSHCSGSFLRIDLTDPALVPLAENLGLPHVGGGTAMTKNGMPMAAHDYTTFALASQALG